MIADDINTNKNFQGIIKELFFRWRKLNIPLVFITQSNFFVPKEVRLNSIYYLITKIFNKKGLRIIAINHLADTDYKDFMSIYRKCTNDSHSFFDYWYYITDR